MESRHSGQTGRMETLARGALQRRQSAGKSAEKRLWATKRKAAERGRCRSRGRLVRARSSVLLKTSSYRGLQGLYPGVGWTQYRGLGGGVQLGREGFMED